MPSFSFSLQDWQDDKAQRGVGYKYAWDRTTFDEIDPQNTDYVLGSISLINNSFTMVTALTAFGIQIGLFTIFLYTLL